MTAITGEYLAALKANVTGDTDTLARLRELLEERDGPRSGDIYGALYSVALATAAQRAFPGGYTSAARADVIRFVARLRGAVAGTDDDFNPRVAEHVLISMLGGPEDIETLDKKDLAVVIVMLIGGLLAYLGIEESGIDDFLSEVSPLAEAWYGRVGGRAGSGERAMPVTDDEVAALRAHPQGNSHSSRSYMRD
jgi:hypothetical protein